MEETKDEPQDVGQTSGKSLRLAHFKAYLSAVSEGKSSRISVDRDDPVNPNDPETAAQFYVSLFLGAIEQVTVAVSGAVKVARQTAYNQLIGAVTRIINWIAVEVPDVADGIYEVYKDVHVALGKLDVFDADFVHGGIKLFDSLFMYSEEPNRPVMQAQPGPKAIEKHENRHVMQAHFMKESISDQIQHRDSLSVVD